MLKQHDYQVTLLLNITVYNAESEEVAKQGAKDLIKNEPHEYIEEAAIIKVKDLGISKIQIDE